MFDSWRHNVSTRVSGYGSVGGVGKIHCNSYRRYCLSAIVRCCCFFSRGPSVGVAAPADGSRRRFRTAIGRESPACCSSGIGRVPWLSAGVSVHRAAGTLCALDSCSGPVRTPSGLGVCRQLGPRVFPDGRCCRYAGNPELEVTFQYRQDHLETVLAYFKSSKSQSCAISFTW